jgi:hypothetical protein
MNRYSLIAALIAGFLACGQARAEEPAATSVSGIMFLDMTDMTTKANGTDVDPTGYGLDVKRFYIGVNHVFDETWSVGFTTDFNYSSTTGETQLFAKKAYLQQRFSDAATLRYGAAEMPWIPYVESFYGYRFVEKTMLDRLALGNTVDWGVHFLGHTDSINYAASVVNGGGYKNPSRSKGMDEEARVGFSPVNGLTFAFGYYTGKLGQDTEAVPAVHTASRTDFLGVWKADGVTAGVEYFTADNFSKALITAPATDKADGYSVFGSYDFGDTGYSVFARYDNAKPSKNVAPAERDKYYNAGFAWKSNPSLTWAAAYKHETLSNTGTELKADEFGIWAQVKF